MGTPYKFGKEEVALYLKTLRRFPIKKHAAETCGVTRQAVDYHRNKDGEWGEFARAERLALAEGRAKLLEGVRSPEWLLSKSDRETYTDRKDLNIGGNITLVIDAGDADEQPL